MGIAQTLLLPDPRPLVERLGADFFRQAPVGPGVYLMRDGGRAVVYVGKAKNLRKRLGSYRVASPERMRRRHLRMLRVVTQIDFQECADETAALAREAELLRQLRPRFNRAGTWPGTPRFLVWRMNAKGLEIAVANDPVAGWSAFGPLSAGTDYLRAALLRLLWCAVHAERGILGLPAGWLGVPKPKRVGDVPASQQLNACEERTGALRMLIMPRLSAPSLRLSEAAARLRFLLAGDTAGFAGWVRERAAAENHPLATAVREGDLLTVCHFVQAAHRGIIR